MSAGGSRRDGTFWQQAVSVRTDINRGANPEPRVERLASRSFAFLNTALHKKCQLVDIRQENSRFLRRAQSKWHCLRTALFGLVISAR